MYLLKSDVFADTWCYQRYNSEFFLWQYINNATIATEINTAAVAAKQHEQYAAEGWFLIRKTIYYGHIPLPLHTANFVCIQFLFLSKTHHLELLRFHTTIKFELEMFAQLGIDLAERVFGCLASPWRPGERSNSSPSDANSPHCHPHISLSKWCPEGNRNALGETLSRKNARAVLLFSTFGSCVNENHEAWGSDCAIVLVTCRRGSFRLTFRSLM